MQKNVLTTGEVARLCNVAPRTVSKWFDSGRLRGYRIPGSKDRRIPLNQLLRFMRAHGIPHEHLTESAKRRILVVDADGEWTSALTPGLAAAGSFEVSVAESSFEAGLMASRIRPHVLLVDVRLPDVIPRTWVHVLRTSSELRGARLVGTGKGLGRAEGESLLQSGFDAYLPKPFDARSLMGILEVELAKGATEDRTAGESAG